LTLWERLDEPVPKRCAIVTYQVRWLSWEAVVAGYREHEVTQYAPTSRYPPPHLAPLTCCLLERRASVVLPRNIPLVYWGK
jgi:hypothetical protein